MADGVPITAGSGTTIATDDAGASGHVQVVKLALSADGSATPVTADANGLEVQVGTALPAGTNAIGKLAANSGVDIGDVDVTSLPDVDVATLPNASSATLSNVNDTASSAQLAASNASRKGLLIFNDSTSALMVKYGTTASATDFTVKIAAGGYWEMPTPIYTGRVDGIWSSDASGAARVTEL